MNIVSFVSKVCKRYGPLALTIGSCAGVGLTAYFTGKAVLEADKLIKNMPEEELKSLETKKKLVKIYSKPIISGAFTIACNIGGYAMGKKAQAGYIAAYSLLYSRFAKYREEVGQDCDALAIEDVNRSVIQEYADEVVEEIHEEDDILWVDDYHKKPYWAKESDMWRGLHYLNKEIFEPTFHKGYATLNEFCDVACIPEAEGGDVRGWSMDYLIDDYDCYIMDIYWTEITTINPRTGLPATAYYLQFPTEPVVGFIDKYWN